MYNVTIRVYTNSHQFIDLFMITQHFLKKKNILCNIYINNFSANFWKFLTKYMLKKNTFLVPTEMKNE